MAKVRVLLECTACGQPAPQWAGRCLSCKAWGTIEERPRAMAARSGGGAPAPVIPLMSPDEPERRLSTGLDGVDRVLGGGLVPGSVVLLAGEPGIGKSTLLLQILAALSAGDRSCLYASGEESRAQVAGRARRLGLTETASFVPGRELPSVLEAVRRERPQVLVVDSIQAMRDPEHTSLPGGVSQVRLCTDALVGLAKAEDVTVVLAGQVTKDGDLAGPRALEHAVDVVCAFDGDPRTGLRVLAGGKNRFGPDGEVAWFEMGPNGLSEIDPAAALGPTEISPGAAIALLAAGRRGLAVEVQALVAPTEGPPRRHVSGLDPRRFALVAAVTDLHADLQLQKAEVYGATTGGLRLDDPGADLALAVAIASAATKTAPPAHTAYCGEVSLTGAVRPVWNLSARLSAAAAAGIRRVVCAGEAVPPRGLEVIVVRHLREALSWCRKLRSGP